MPKKIGPYIFCLLLAIVAFGAFPAVELHALVQNEQNPQSKNSNPDASEPAEIKIQSVVRDNNTFATQLYALLKKQEGNLFFSPYSISSALAMTYAGASGITQEQMQKVLHFSLPETETLAGFSALQHFFTRRSDVELSPRLLLANSLWIQSGFSLLPSFLDVMTRNFLAALHEVDFSKHTEDARTEINRWVKEHTEGRISDLLSSNDLQSSTRLVLASAIYMKANWLVPFDEKNTHSGSFFSPGKTVSVPMMDHTGFFPLYQGDSFAALELPYRSAPGTSSPKLAMLVLLPKEKQGIASFEAELTEPNLAKWITLLKQQRVHILLPKFTFTQSFSLNDALKNLGMGSAFIPNQADFSRMTGSKDLMIGQVVHKAFIAVDENGTEAAAATAVSMNLTAILEPEKPYEFIVDHPFGFVIFEKTTGSILFIGRVSTP